MGFDITKERIRFRRHGKFNIRWEIPELGRWGFAGTPSTALSAARDRVRALTTGAVDELKAEIDDAHDHLANLLNELADLESAEHSTLPGLIEEQSPYLERALEFLEPSARFRGYEVQVVGILDVGGEDTDGDLDFKITLGCKEVNGQ